MMRRGCGSSSISRHPAVDDDIDGTDEDTRTAAVVSALQHQVDDQLRGQNKKRKDMKLAGYGDTWNFGGYHVEKERVNDRRARCDLSLDARLGGYSAPRTHRGKECFSVMTITFDLIHMVENVPFYLVVNVVFDDTCLANSLTSERGS